MAGDNIANLSNNMNWYNFDTVLDILDKFKKEETLLNKPFRMPVQDIYKFTKFDDSRRIVAGTIESGSIHVGDEIIFCPSGKKNRIKSIELFNQSDIREISAGYAAGMTLHEQIYITRGEIMVKVNEPQPERASRIKVALFWLGKRAMTKDKEYFFKTGTAKIPVKLEKINRTIDASSLESTAQKEVIERNDVAECILKLSKVAAFDIQNNIAATNRFVIVDNYEISGGGIIHLGLEDEDTSLQNKVFLRNYKWEKGNISSEKRAEKYGHNSALILITGDKNVNRKSIAKRLEENLFNDNRQAYFMGIGNILYGLNTDIKNDTINHPEHLRRLAEISNLMIDAGNILIVTASELSQSDLEIIKTSIESDKIKVIWMGEKVTTDIYYDLKIPEDLSFEHKVLKIKKFLEQKGVFLRGLSSPK